MAFLKLKEGKMSHWKFLTNHAVVLLSLTENPTCTARELALTMEITERAVRKIIADLETEGYLEKFKEGRRLRFKINSKLPFRHPAQKDKAVGMLLDALNETQKLDAISLTGHAPAVHSRGSEAKFEI